MRKTLTYRGGVILFVASLIAATIGLFPRSLVKGAPILTITPITWNVIGLDSNNPAVGPNIFPVGARVCNTGPDPATNVVSNFIWDTTDLYINLRTGSYSTFTHPTLAPGDCVDFYYEVEITRNVAAYWRSARYHITATADTLSTISTPTPREVYVEKLISQNRNYNFDILLDGASVPAGGTMALIVGQTYEITLIGSTATNGYEQLSTL